ncbi:8400_t:CDS:10, partial [Gigaspora rosea]
MQSLNPKKQVTVIGAGISGLTTAVLLQEQYNVTIVSRELPGELKDGYTSPWAGAHWRSHARLDDIRQQGFDKETFIHFWDLAHTKPSETGIMIVDGFEYWDEYLPLEWNDPWFKDLCPQYRHLTKDELPIDVEFGIKYKTVTINPPKYLSYLLDRFYALGGTIKRVTLSHIQEAIFDNTDIIINCSGLGSKTLGGVQDQDVYPASGQTVLVQLPIGHVNWTCIRSAVSITKIFSSVKQQDNEELPGKGERINYIIPRDNGEVVLGGFTQLVRMQVSTTPDAKIADAIIARCLSTRPDLLPKGETKLKIIRHGVGLRPVRKNGVRIEAEWILSEKTGKKILLCHNYGHGGSGWQSSYGASMHVIQTLKQSLSE